MPNLSLHPPAAQPGVIIRNIAGVQILRGLAALAVLLHHTLEETFALIKVPSRVLRIATLVGASGVDVFFVISGFIMLYSTWRHFGKPGAAMDFAVRRLIRIGPLYWLCTLLVLALAATGVFYKNKTISIEDSLLSLTFLPTPHLVLGVGWTLQYEMYFYVLFSLAIFWGTPRSAVVGVPLTLVGILICARSFLDNSPVQSFLADPIAIEFGYGLVLAYGFARGWRIPASTVVLTSLGVFGLVVASALAPSVSTNGLAISVRFLLWGIPAAIILAAALNAVPVDNMLTHGFIWLGDISYSLYLTHAFVMIAYAKLLTIPAVAALLPPFAGAALAIFASLMLAYGVHVAIEQRANDMLRALWSERASNLKRENFG